MLKNLPLGRVGKIVLYGVAAIAASVGAIRDLKKDDEFEAMKKDIEKLKGES